MTTPGNSWGFFTCFLNVIVIVHTCPSRLWSTKTNTLRPILSKSGSCLEILWEHWPSRIDLDKNWGTLRNYQIKFNISEDTLGKAHEQKAVINFSLFISEGKSILMDDSLWCLIQYGSKTGWKRWVKFLALGWAGVFTEKTVHGLKDKHVQRLLSSLTLKVWCNFTLKAHIRSMLRQHRKSSVDHHNSKVWILSVTYLYIYMFLNTVSLSIKQGPTCLFYLS